MVTHLSTPRELEWYEISYRGSFCGGLDVANDCVAISREETEEKHKGLTI
jgi:hypothetical protein